MSQREGKAWARQASGKTGKAVQRPQRGSWPSSFVPGAARGLEWLQEEQQDTGSEKSVTCRACHGGPCLFWRVLSRVIVLSSWAVGKNTMAGSRGKGQETGWKLL